MKKYYLLLIVFIICRLTAQTTKQNVDEYYNDYISCVDSVGRGNAYMCRLHFNKLLESSGAVVEKLSLMSKEERQFNMGRVSTLLSNIFKQEDTLINQKLFDFLLESDKWLIDNYRHRLSPTFISPAGKAMLLAKMDSIIKPGKRFSQCLMQFLCEARIPGIEYYLEEVIKHAEAHTDSNSRYPIPRYPENKDFSKEKWLENRKKRKSIYDTLPFLPAMRHRIVLASMGYDNYGKQIADYYRLMYFHINNIQTGDYDDIFRYVRNKEFVIFLLEVMNSDLSHKDFNNDTAYPRYAIPGVLKFIVADYDKYYYNNLYGKGFNGDEKIALTNKWFEEHPDYSLIK